MIPGLINGIDEAGRALASSMPGHPGPGREQFSPRTEWRDGAHTTTADRHFTVLPDKPAAPGGTDRAPNAIGLLFSAPGA